MVCAPLFSVSAVLLPLPAFITRLPGPMLDPAFTVIVPLPMFVDPVILLSPLRIRLPEPCFCNWNPPSFNVPLSVREPAEFETEM